MQMTQTTNGPITFDQFNLHDGEDDKKTVELHTFLDPMVDKKQIFEWEGHESGITIVLDVRPGDTIQRSEDGWLRVVPRTELGSIEFTEKDM
jgi:hypothetical protein